MSAPLSEQQLDAIRTFIGDAKPATDELLLSFGKSVADRREHDHASQREDWYCLNLAAYMGERAAPVLRRLLDAEEQSEQRRQQAAASAASEETLQAQIDAQAKEVDRLRAERDAFADRVDTLTSVAQGNKRHVMDLMGDLSAAQSRIAELEKALGAAGRRDVTSALAVIVKHGDMSETVRQELRDLLADPKGGAS